MATATASAPTAAPTTHQTVKDILGERMSTPLEIETTQQGFCAIRTLDKNLLSVNVGTPGIYALQHAVCLLEAIKDITQEGIQTEMSCNTAWLVNFAADAAQAFLHSIEGPMEFGARAIKGSSVERAL